MWSSDTNGFHLAWGLSKDPWCHFSIPIDSGKVPGLHNDVLLLVPSKIWSLHCVRLPMSPAVLAHSCIQRHSEAGLGACGFNKDPAGNRFYL